MISIGKTLFLILMPLVYRGFHSLILRVDYTDMEKKLTNIITLSVYYIIELIYILILHHASKEWLFMKETKCLSETGAFPIFVFLAVVFIIIHLWVCNIDAEENVLPVVHLVVLIILFAIYTFCINSMTKDKVDENIFNNMPYEISNEYTIHLKALSDTHTTEGQINGGRFYINGSINDNYEIYYSFIDNEGSTVIRHFSYSEEYVKIYETDDCTDPRIEFTTYHKEYKKREASYTNYVIHIPTGTNNITMDME